MTAEASQTPPVASNDAAWASLTTPLTVAELALACGDVEVLLRVNPYYTFHAWSRGGPDTYAVDLENGSNETRSTFSFHVERNGPGMLSICYSGGLKKRTVFTIEPATVGSRLTITDDYDRLPEQERQQRVGEVDRSLVAWRDALRAYFLRMKRWSWLPGWRWYLQRVWIPMRPSARRIVWLLYLFTIAEFIFFLFVMLIYVTEHAD
jgi:hypothetical protein